MIKDSASHNSAFSDFPVIAVLIEDALSGPVFDFRFFAHNFFIDNL